MTLETNKKWSDIADDVAEGLQREHARPNPRQLRRYATEFVHMICERTHCYKKSWTNTPSTGEITLSGYTCALPNDLIRLERVEYDGSDEPLEYKTLAQLDEECAGWRDQTGDPSFYTIDGQNVLLDSTPSGADSKLTLRGSAYLPPIKDTDTTATTSLQYLPFGLQNTVSDYVLANWPADLYNPIEASRQEAAQKRVDMQLARLDAELATRQGQPFTY